MACVAQKNRHFHLATNEKVQRFKDAKVEYRAEKVSARGHVALPGAPGREEVGVRERECPGELGLTRLL